LQDNPGPDSMSWATALRLLTATLLALLSAAATSPGAAPEFPSDEPLAPIPPPEPVDTAKVALGRKLFDDARLSRDDVVACSSCHRLDRGGDDDRDRSPGTDGRPLDFNTPTIFNVALNFRLNWRGNYRTLEEQNEAVLLDPRLMGMTWDELLAKLRADPDYGRTFGSLYGTGPERASVLDALAAFQRSLLTPDSRFDRYLRGRHDAITADEERGYRLFKSYGCTACHQGANVGGNLFQKFGIFADPTARRGAADLGRFTITGNEEDRHVFRVPSLRNVAVTAPYFHGGATSLLSEATEIMARVQLGRDLPPQDVDLIVKFLATLTGEYQGRPLAADAARARR
jgi:cytochrome c peroxidase